MLRYNGCCCGFRSVIPLWYVVSSTKGFSTMVQITGGLLACKAMGCAPSFIRERKKERKKEKKRVLELGYVSKVRGLNLVSTAISRMCVWYSKKVPQLNLCYQKKCQRRVSTRRRPPDGSVTNCPSNCPAIVFGGLILVLSWSQDEYACIRKTCSGNNLDPGPTINKKNLENPIV